MLVIAGKSREEVDEEKRSRWEGMGIEEHIQMYLDQGMDPSYAIPAYFLWMKIFHGEIPAAARKCSGTSCASTRN